MLNTMFVRAMHRAARIRAFSTPATLPAPEAALPPPPPPPPTSSFWPALLALALGAGAGGSLAFYAASNQQENNVTRSEVERSAGALRAEVAGALVEQRQRVALLEHEVAGLKRDIAAWGK